MTTIQGVVRGRTIELEREPGVPDGQVVAVTIEPVQEPSSSGGSKGAPGVELWMDRLVFDSAILSGERVVKGTSLAAEALVTELEQGRSDREMLQAHRELAPEDLAALRHYARVPVGLRRSFGAWAEDAEELDKYLEWTRRQRKIGRRGIEL